MIRLRDSVLIHVPPERIWAWLNELPVHYRDWHPAHITCRYEHGERLEAGTVLYAEEIIHNRIHRLRLTATEVVPGRVVRYRGNGFTGAFLIDPSNGCTSFTAELDFGFRRGVFSSILDAVLRRALGRRLGTLQAHMHEEGVNLRQLLEAGRPA